MALWDDPTLRSYVARAVLIQGSGGAYTPVSPDFMEVPRKGAFDYTIERLLRAFATGADATCSVRDSPNAM